MNSLTTTCAVSAGAIALAFGYRLMTSKVIIEVNCNSPAQVGATVVAAAVVSAIATKLLSR